MPRAPVLSKRILTNERYAKALWVGRLTATMM
jgi:hypothetical protein